MGRQIRFYMTPGDFQDANRRISGRLSYVILADRSTTRKVTQLSEESVNGQVRVGCRLYLARPSDLDLIKVKHVSSGGYWRPDQFHSPIVEVRLEPFDGKTLRQGRLYYEARYLDDDGQWVDWPKEFTDWAAALFRALKKELTRHTVVFGDVQYLEYIGQEADAWRQSTGARYLLNRGFVAGEFLASANGCIADREIAAPAPTVSRSKKGTRQKSRGS